MRRWHRTRPRERLECYRRVAWHAPSPGAFCGDVRPFHFVLSICQVVIDAFSVAPVVYVIGNEFTIVGYKNSEFVVSLGGNSLMPYLNCGASFLLSTQGDTPHITREVID